MPDLPMQINRDEKDLDRVKIGTYAWCGFIVASTALTLYGVFSSMAIFGLRYTAFSATVAAVFGFLYAYANYRSAKAIAQRVDPHLTFFVAGINMAAFPFGSLLSWYTWHVMTRGSVQQLYKEGTPGLAPVNLKKTDKPKAVDKKPSLVEAPEVHWGEVVSEADDAEEALWRKLEEAYKQATGNGAQKESQPQETGSDGSIRLVSGDE
jgi:hypothetical protein